jgi:hypothetical protein
MSKIALTPSATGTGVFTISSPATNTNRTLTLPDEAGTVLTSASSLASANLTGALPAISGAALTNVPLSGVIVGSGFSYVNHNTTATYANLGGITLPSSGVWNIRYQSRFGWSNQLGFHNLTLSTSTTSGGNFSTTRMVGERMGTNGGTANISGMHEWTLDVAYGNASRTVYILSYMSGSAGSSFFQHDTNGTTGITAVYIRESTTAGTGLTQIGF